MACFCPGLSPSRSATTLTESPSWVNRTVPCALLLAVACRTATACLIEAQACAWAISPCGASAARTEESGLIQRVEVARMATSEVPFFIGNVGYGYWCRLPDPLHTGAARRKNQAWFQPGFLS